MTAIRDFVGVYRLYRRAHGPRYSAFIAWQIAVKKTPF